MAATDGRMETSGGRDGDGGTREVRERIEITIKTDGKIEMEQKGYSGPTCVEDAIAQLVKAHSDVIEDRVTKDYHNPRPAVNVNYVDR